MASAREQIQAMADLRENWDGYGAAAPKPNVLEAAGLWVEYLERLFSRSEGESRVLHVSPTRLGGVLIEWQDQTTQHEMDLQPDNSISFLHCNLSTGNIETRKFVASHPSVMHPGILRELTQLLAA